MTKNIIFDLSEVIISGYHGFENRLEKEKKIPKEDFIKRKQETLEFFLDTMRGSHTEEEYWEYLIKGTNWNTNSLELKKLVRENLNIPVEGTLEIIKKLKKNYKLILLSDHVKEWMEYILENNEMLEIFDTKFLSYELKKIKIDEGCFEELIKRTRINPEETIFIDDYEKNINSAKKCGIDGIVFKSAKELEEELRKKNILL